MITRQVLEQRRAALLAQREQAAVTLHACSGAIALCDELLKALPPEPAPPEVPSPEAPTS